MNTPVDRLVKSSLRSARYSQLARAWRKHCSFMSRLIGSPLYHHGVDVITLQGDVWSLGCALYKWTTGKEFAYLAAGARLQDTLHLVPPSWGDKASPGLPTTLPPSTFLVNIAGIYISASSIHQGLLCPWR